MSDWSAEETQRKFALLEMSKQPGNNECADCTAKAPRWASFNFGVFLCLKCAGIHRGYGRDISRVKSITLDKWTAEEFSQMIGNERANSILLYNLPPGMTKPNETDEAARSKWLNNKYVRKTWMRRPDQYQNNNVQVQSVPQKQTVNIVQQQQQIPAVQKQKIENINFFQTQTKVHEVPTQVQPDLFGDFLTPSPIQQNTKANNDKGADLFASMFGEPVTAPPKQVIVPTLAVPPPTVKESQVVLQAPKPPSNTTLDFFDISNKTTTCDRKPVANNVNILDLFDVSSPTQTQVQQQQKKNNGFDFFDFSNTQTVLPNTTQTNTSNSGYHPTTGFF